MGVVAQPVREYMENIAAIVVHLLLAFTLPPLLLGIINKTKAFFAGRGVG